MATYSFLLDSTDDTIRRIALVRDLVDDTTLVIEPSEGKNYFLSDERIAVRLTDATRDGRRERNIIRLAAASALDTLATNQAYVLKVGETLGEKRDGARVADSIRGHAQSLRVEVQTEESSLTETVTRPEFYTGSISVQGTW